MSFSRIKSRKLHIAVFFVCVTSKRSQIQNLQEPAKARILIGFGTDRLREESQGLFRSCQLRLAAPLRLPNDQTICPWVSEDGRRPAKVGRPAWHCQCAKYCAKFHACISPTGQSFQRFSSPHLLHAFTTAS